MMGEISPKTFNKIQRISPGWSPTVVETSLQTSVNPSSQNWCCSIIPFAPFCCRHRKVDDEEMGGGARCCFGFLMTLAQILLHGALGLVLYWVFRFHRKDDQTWPFSWKEDPKAEFWIHPVLMIAGFIYFMGQCEFCVYTTLI